LIGKIFFGVIIVLLCQVRFWNVVIRVDHNALFAPIFGDDYVYIWLK